MRIDSMDASLMQLKNTQNTVQNTLGVKKTSLENNNVQKVTKDEGQNYSDVTAKEIIDAIEKANKAIIGARTQLEFSIHEGTKEILVKVINTETKEVIREIPSEKILDMVAKMWELAGILVDERR
ncbi:flagellar protein FlaG [Acetivibrio saccincola]|jgi:flagellar protein FlaG|uniref:Flagellar biosynthesis protein FlaG n=1 Tax=Acetivibrio saccincola TaxID=1677857 RepID=A0A2K9EI11_9FIRM|nr:flagellar protein FlaG [Acetivibrio saccincola]AUG57139.1 flagellar protein FlaG [Acetivibrio saccincola]AUG58865.1 flagellar protein FlaG [Acetivibrio saccincola]PQQ66046.1 flagellar biosynthesis protein FlaG [Acetivibrio saccincola]